MGRSRNVVALTVDFRDMVDLPTDTRVAGELFPEARPSRTVVQIGALAMPDLLAEITATAAL
ncbi:MAG: RidA family protein [Pseudonocardia sp.]|nr:RidA family protein [Pseudonocardia sp.]